MFLLWNFGSKLVLKFCIYFVPLSILILKCSHSQISYTIFNLLPSPKILANTRGIEKYYPVSSSTLLFQIGTIILFLLYDLILAFLHFVLESLPQDISNSSRGEGCILIILHICIRSLKSYVLYSTPSRVIS